MEKSWIVLKFGGTSVSSIERWKTIASTLETYISEGYRPLVVCSALAGESNLLEKMLADAELGNDVRAGLDEVIRTHHELAGAMDLDADEVLGDLFEELRRLTSGARLVEEASPRTRARVMSMGELMSTRLGAAWLSRHGLRASWQDAREMLTALEGDTKSVATGRNYLSAVCSHDPDPELEARLRGLEADVVLTQGFIASDSRGDTVLLGRGGSDTSAAYFAARVSAERLEIWTDVPGMFTANPRQIRTARLLRHLNYEEAQQLALMGAKVLHPRCVAPVAAQDIPLHVKCTNAPDMVGTIISSRAPSDVPQVKAVSARQSVVLISMELDRSLQNVGFMADAAAVFKEWGVSIDMVTASETNVTVSVDPKAQALEEDVLDNVVAELKELCHTRVIGPCAAVSLVGSNIRAILHELGPILERFEDQKVYMVSQAADDLNFTFIVGEDEADRLIVDLHTQLFPPDLPDPTFGPTWELLFSEAPETKVLPGWWIDRREAILEEAEQGTPCFVYDEESLDRAVKELDELPLDRLFYSVKANPNPSILRRLDRAGVSFQVGTPGELAHLREVLGDISNKAVFAPHAPTPEQIREGFEAGAQVVVGNLQLLEHSPDLFQGKDIFLRFDPGRGAPGQPFVRSAGPQDKFGIAPADVQRAKAAVQAADANVVGLHAHAGSGLRTTETWREIGLLLVSLAEQFPSVSILDLGGGLGVPERVAHSRVDLKAVARGLEELKDAHPQYSLWMEPGRFLVARAGVLAARVMNVVVKEGHSFVTIDAGMNSLIRPALYGAWHETVNLSRWGQRMQLVADVVGPLGESLDVLAHGRHLPATRPGDVVLIANAGAYGRSMASYYNSVSPAREAMLAARDE